MLSCFGALALTVAVSGCASRIDTRGSVLDPENVAQIKPGESTKNDVTQLLGSPSTTGNFDGPGNAWYYYNQRTETVAFFKPEVQSRKILAVRFAEDGKVDTLSVLDESSGQEVAVVDRVTPTSGNEITFIQQLFGNLGRFTPTGSNASRATPGSGGGVGYPGADRQSGP
jgi:outer membrane protein assembly factor BamE (lipoprotein component of BamABCDE complex)